MTDAVRVVPLAAILAHICTWSSLFIGLITLYGEYSTVEFRWNLFFVMPLFALLVWPIIALVIFKSLGRVKGVVWATLIGALFLPEAFNVNLPGLPPFDKEMSIILGALLGLAATHSRAPSAPAQGDGFAKSVVYGLGILFVLSSFFTVFNNGEALSFGPITVKGLDFRDLLTMMSATMVFLVPYFIAQRTLSDPESHAILLRAFVIMGLIYSLLILFEARMSPQLHNWTYGYFQHVWQQHIRGGKFRPIVFQQHGLWIGILLLMCTMSAFILLKNRVAAGEPRVQYLVAGFWLLLVMLLSRNTGVVVLAAAFVPVLWFFGPRLQVWVAIAVMVGFLIHPVLRQPQIVTLDRVVEMAGWISAERQSSLAYRINNEEQFMDRAALKPATGWGIWARWRIRDEVTGEDTSTSDGRWISILGERGWIGFLGYFGLLTAPTLLLLRTARRRPLAPATAGLAMIMAAIMVYQIPNNTIGPLVLIIAGALAGFVTKPAAAQSDPGQPETLKPGNRTMTYTRFPQARPRGAGPEGQTSRS